jgi:hypothetical protein
MMGNGSSVMNSLTGWFKEARLHSCCVVHHELYSTACVEFPMDFGRTGSLTQLLR